MTTASGGSPAEATASRTSAPSAALECAASLPPRSITALPLLMQSAAASTVTLGRAS